VDGVVVCDWPKTVWLCSHLSVVIVAGWATLSLASFSAFLFSTATVLLLGHSLGCHRKLIHNSFSCPRWLEYILVYVGVQVGLAGPLGLLQQHDLRDYAQRQSTCHSYLRHGEALHVDAVWQLFCTLILHHPPKCHLESSLSDNAFYHFLERTWMLQCLLLTPFFYLLGGWSFIVWGISARVVVAVVGHWLIGYWAHNRGERHFHIHGAAVQAGNLRGTSLITMGECWHNNHHAFPWSARLGLQAGEWDPGWWLIVFLEKMGLVWAIQQPTVQQLGQQKSGSQITALRGVAQ